MKKENIEKKRGKRWAFSQDDTGIKLLNGLSGLLLLDQLFLVHLKKYKEPVVKKLEGVGPLDNRPYPEKLHNFVEKKEEKKM